MMISDSGLLFWATLYLRIFCCQPLVYYAA